MSAPTRSAWWAPTLSIILLSSALLQRAHAAFIPFDNCLPDSILLSQPKLLQFTPLFMDAAFDTEKPSHALTLTIYGNVSGQQYEGVYPPPDSPHWSDNGNDFGKINNTGNDDKYSTLQELYQVLTFTTFDNRSEFCNSLENGTCPLGPSFHANASNPYDLPAIVLSLDFNSSYAFASILPTIKIISGDVGAQELACVSATVTPDLGRSIANLLTWLPAAILILKAVATISAAVWSPWGSWDIFRWSSNYGRDEDLLRLVTPGFGDCLQYIQFVVLTGSLSLQYPGFYQPAVSQASWSLLLFNESFVSHGNGTQSLNDGIYSANATYGLTQMSQLIGMSRVDDIWACMAIWLLVIAVAVVILCQVGFLARAVYRSATHTSEEDLRSKNIPFTLGHMNRLLFNFFILPIVSVSLFQLVVAARSPTSVIVCAVILLAIMIISAGWILRVIFATKPRTILFDEMPTVLLYGPLYNTYSDSAAPFALIPVFITFIRGVAIGAVQPSGIAQVIILAICEVILILTLNGFRPFQGQTSMNLYHTAFAAVRLVTVLLMIAFVPSLGVSQPPKGWIGYVILILHACVLIFGFFLNAAQTLIEVIARAFGAGDDSHSGVIRGSILSWRMLKKRQDRPEGDRRSMMSGAAILGDQAAANFGGRSRSMSASSNQLLNRHSGLENFSNAGEPLGSPDPELDFAGSAAAGSFGKPSLGSRADAAEFYRPPRPRKGTFDAISFPGTKTRKSGGASEFPYQDSPGPSAGHARGDSYESGGHDSPAPAPAFLRERHGSNDSTMQQRTDYAVREVDQYYRGPALNDQPTRKLKTGPADPEGAASTAQTWFQRLMFGMQGKKKDQSKGFEVVRSSRMAPGMQEAEEGVEMQTSPPMHQEPYSDAPNLARQLSGPDGETVRAISPVEDDDLVEVPRSQAFDFGFDGAKTQSEEPSKLRPDSETVSRPALQFSDADPGPSTRQPERQSALSALSDEAPSLGPLETGEEFRFPSRFNSRASGNMPLRFDTAGATTAAAATASGARDESGLSTSPDGQDWLRAVDSLQWNHDREARAPSSSAAAPTTTSIASPSQPLTTPTLAALVEADTNNTLDPNPPEIPRRSSRRASSQGQSPARPPDPPDTQTQDIFDGFDSSPSSPTDLLVVRSRTNESAIDDDDEQAEQAIRTTGFTNVHHHRAADSITRNSFGANAALHASSAEYFGEEPGSGSGEGR